jgi:vacuolar-type H+-ATPase subunit H
MADNDVAALERQVEESRQRLASTLDKLADPATHQAMKDEVMARVTGYKDQLLGGARGTGQTYADDLKARAMNNPAAVALIGAGIAYRLYRHPPVTTLLLGAGVALLMRARGRTSSDPTAYRAPYDREQPRGYVPGGVAGYGYPVEEDAPGSTTTDRMVAAASQAGERAREIAEDTRSRLSTAAHEAGSRISETAEQARSLAQDTYERTRSAAQDTYGQARSMAQDTYERTAAGAGDAYGRASEMFETVRRNPLALGLLGIAVGALAGRALRSTDTGDSFVGAAGDVLGRGARGVGSGTRYAARRAADTASGLGSAVSSAAGGVASSVSSAASGVASSVTSAAAGAAEAVGGLAASVTGGGSEADESDDRAPARGRGSRGGRSRSGGRGRARSAGREDADEEGFMTSAAEAASAAYRGAAGQADYARRRTADLAGQVADQVSDLGRNYPLLLGAIGIAAGAAVGLAMRPTESEDDLIGPYADSLKARAREAFSEQYQEVMGAAEDLAESFAGGGQSPGAAPAADWETVIGGGAPPAQGGAAAAAGSEVGPRE